jgi:hypothetical protein
MILRLIPLIISWLILAAHFLRYGNLVLAGLCLAVPLSLLIQKRVVLNTVQWLTFGGVLLWIKIGIDLVTYRLAIHVDYTRLMIILSAIALFTLGSGLLLYHRSFRKLYR